MLRIKYKGVIHVIPKTQIIYCKASGNYITIFSENGRRITVYLSLNRTMNLLASKDFFRCHNSTVINLRQITEFDLRRREVVLKSGTKIIISCRKKADLIKKLNTFNND
jgi:two-component system LytT family response regulator